MANFHGSMGGIPLQRPVVGIVPTADRGGYWLDASDGGVFAFGDTVFHGSIPGLGLHPAGSGQPLCLNAPIVGMVASHDYGGYFMVGSDGGVFAFGDAHYVGSCPGIGGCSGAAVAVMPDASGNGYWLVTKTGNVYGFGDGPTSERRDNKVRRSPLPWPPPTVVVITSLTPMVKYSRTVTLTTPWEMWHQGPPVVSTPLLRSSPPRITAAIGWPTHSERYLPSVTLQAMESMSGTHLNGSITCGDGS